MSKLTRLKEKIHFPTSHYAPLLHLWKSQQEKLVFTNGCFDLVHQGHLEYMAKAADLGSKLIVGINSDDSTHRLKGAGRPVNTIEARTLLLASLSFVDLVIVFEEDTPYNLIKEIQPDVLVKGKDYRAEEIVGYDIVTEKGGTVETIELVSGFSSTSLIEKIATTYGKD